MTSSEQLVRVKSYIGWMRKKITLSLDGYDPGWDKSVRAGVGSVLPHNGDDTCVQRKGYIRPRIVCMALLNRELPPAPSRVMRKPPDLKCENPSFAAMLVKYVNERFDGDAPKAYGAAKVSRKTYSAIVGNELRPVSKATAIQFALALHLTRSETDEFIKSAGYALSAFILEDIIVCACIECGIYEIADVNELMSSYGAKTFATEVVSN